MQIVIDIPQGLKDDFESERWTALTCAMMKDALMDGTPLPKGHGRLMILSEDAVKREQTLLNFSCQKWISEVGLSNATMAIIEADKAGDEE